MLDRVRLLCNDADIEVRQVIAEETLFRIAKNVSKEIVEIYIIDKVK